MIINSRISNYRFRIVTLAIYIFLKLLQEANNNSRNIQSMPWTIIIIEVWWKRWQLQLKIQGSETSREINIMRVMLSYSQNWISKLLLLRNHTSREKPKKGTKHQRIERHDIRGVITNRNHQIYYIRIIEIVNER